LQRTSRATTSRPTWCAVAGESLSARLHGSEHLRIRHAHIRGALERICRRHPGQPPFMSPKGGIKPHKRFSIQAKRSEVLFVDYMAEHLTPTGRAGIIVPEGLSSRARPPTSNFGNRSSRTRSSPSSRCRPAAFNPYSGVKTSILILDKSLARRSDTIAFFRVENDGFGLGAQRRAFEKNDLPAAAAFLEAYLHPSASPGSIPSTRTHSSCRRPRSPRTATTTSAASGIGREQRANHAFPLVSLGEASLFPGRKRRHS